MLVEARPGSGRGPFNAADVGYPYHLIIKDLNCEDAEPGDIAYSVGRFLRRLFGSSDQSPVRYGFHTVISEGSRRTLHLSFTRVPSTTVSLDLALRSFCHKFFTVDPNTAHQACIYLSDSGMYGFSPQDEVMKICWYEAMFEWLRGYRRDRMVDLQQNLVEINRQGRLASWLPTWSGVFLFAASIGFSAFLVSDVPRGAAEGAGIDVAAIDALLILIGDAKDSEDKAARGAAESADATCRDFVRQTEGVIQRMRESPTSSVPAPKKPQGVIAKDMTMQLITLFESGFSTVTACRLAVTSFVAVKKTYVDTGMFFLAFNLYVMAELAEDAFASPTAAGSIAGAQLLFSAGQLLWASYKGYQANKQQEKWTRAAVLVATSIQHGQYCELYLRWMYNSDSGNGPQQGSPGYTHPLESLMRQMNMATRAAADCTDVAVRARLLKLSDMLEIQKNDLNTCLGSSGI